MTKESRDQWGRRVAIAVGLLTLLGFALAGADDRYVRQQTYKADRATIDGKLDRMLDVVCEGKEHTRACQP